MAFGHVISTLLPDGEEVMGPEVLLWHYPRNDIVSGTLLTVESNQYCVLKSRGAVIYVYETGQYPVATSDKPMVGSIIQGFYGGQSPWQYEALYINRAKLVVKTTGLALSKEMAEMSYDVDYYLHVNNRDDALRLVQHMPYRGHTLTTAEVNVYAGPVVEQAVNQVVQVTPLESVNERIHDLTKIVFTNLQQFLIGYGITLDTVKVLVYPRDERMRSLISLKAFGLTEVEAVRYHTAMVMAQHGIISAPNMAVGQPFNFAAVPTLATDKVGVAVTSGNAMPAPQTHPKQAGQ